MPRMMTRILTALLLLLAAFRQAPAADADRVCRYAERQSKGMILDLCRTMETDPGLRLAWTHAYETANRKALLASVTGAGSILLVGMGWLNAITNVGDCFDTTIGVEERPCGNRPVGIYLFTGAAFGIASIVTALIPNTDRDEALDLSRRR